MIQEWAVKIFYLTFACGNGFLAVMRLYRAYAGTMPGGLVTFSNSGAAMLSKKQCMADALYGICYLAFAVAYLFLASIRNT